MPQTTHTASPAATDARDKRWSIFGIGRADTDRLTHNAAFAEQSPPRLLERWNDRFAKWPEIQSALAIAFHENDVPGYAVAIRHATVIKGVIAALGLDEEASALFRAAERRRKAAFPRPDSRRLTPVTTLGALTHPAFEGYAGETRQLLPSLNK